MGKEVIKEFFLKAGVLPTNHMVVVQRQILDEHPWVALELYKAFENAKHVAYDRTKSLTSAYLLFEGEDAKNQARVFGADPFPLGVEKNRKMLEIHFRASHAQGLTKKLKRTEDVFYWTTLDT